MRIDLKVPFPDNDKAKALGARWDIARKTWFIVDPEDLMPFKKWLDGKIPDNWRDPK